MLSCQFHLITHEPPRYNFSGLQLDLKAVHKGSS